MTEQKSLKRLVRARMARTGESYATAHRHVTATRAGGTGVAADQPGVVPGYPAFGPETHQPSALARHLLGAAGLDVSEPLACGLGGGVGFLYAVFEYREVAHPLLTVVAQHHPQPWLEAVGENLGVDVTLLHSSSTGAARSKLDAALDDGLAVQLTVDRARLPHHADVPPMAAADPYVVVVAGRRHDHYLVDDVGHEPHVLAADELMAAWQGHRKGRFALATLDRSAVARVDGDALAEGVGRAVGMTVDHLTGPVLGNSFDVNLGLSGMAKLSRELTGTTKAGWGRRYPSAEGASYACGRLAECLTTSYTAVGGTRPLYASFLREAAVLRDDPTLARAADLVERSGEEWARTADRAREAATVLAGAGTASGSAGAGEVFATLAAGIDACRALEEEACGLLAAEGYASSAGAETSGLV